jgi:putative flippase GtrA
MYTKLRQIVAAPVESVFLQVPRALAVSVLALSVDFAILEIGVHAFNLPAIPVSVLGYLTGGVLQYVLCSYWVFSTTVKNDAVGFLAFTLLSLVGLAITWLAMLLAQDGATCPVEIAKGVAVGLAFTWNFLSRKYLLFRAAPALESARRSG